MSARQSLPPLIRILLMKKKRKKNSNKQIGESFNMVLDETVGYVFNIHMTSNNNGIIPSRHSRSFQH
jgi:hypothetical protein